MDQLGQGNRQMWDHATLCIVLFEKLGVRIEGQCKKCQKEISENLNKYDWGMELKNWIFHRKCKLKQNPEAVLLAISCHMIKYQDH